MTKVSELDAATPAGTDLVYLTDDPGGTPSSKRATAQSIADLVLPSPAFTGEPTAPTPATADSSTKLATTAYVAARIQNDTDEVGDGDFITFTDVGGVQIPTPAPELNYVVHNYTGTSLGNSTSEGNLATASWTIPADEMTIDTTVYELAMTGQYVNNTGSARDLTLRLKHGSNALLTATFSSVASNASGRPWTFRGFLKPITFGIAIWSGSGVFTLGAAGGGVAAETRVHGVTGANTVDETVANSIIMTAQHSAASASLTVSQTIGVVKRLS